MAKRESNRIFWVLGGIAVLSVAGLATTIAISVSHDVSDGYIPPDERDGAGPVEIVAALTDGGVSVQADEPTVELGAAPRDYDEDAIARVLVDGGMARPREPLDITPRRLGPTPPSLALERAHLFQGMLDTQVGQLQSRLDRAREEGNDGLERRLARQIARLEAERGPLEQRIGELETDLERAEREPDPPSTESP